jgi:chromosome partitioning protein
MSTWLREQGHSVAFLDADVQRSSSQWVSAMDPEVRVTCLHTPDEIIEQAPGLAEAVDYLVADGPGGLTEQTRALLLIADVAVIPVGPSALDLLSAQQAVRVVQQAQQIRAGKPRAKLVLNRVQSRTRLAREADEAIRTLGLPVVSHPVGLRTSFADASGQATVVWEMGSGAKQAAQDLDRVFREVMDDGAEEPVGDVESGGAAVPRRGEAKALERAAEARSQEVDPAVEWN